MGITGTWSLEVEAETKAASLGHTLSPWKPTNSNDPHGRIFSYCVGCDALAIVHPDLTLDGWAVQRKHEDVMQEPWVRHDAAKSDC